MMLEAFEHERCAFVTLTYSDDKLPTDGSLQPQHLKDWLKRLRARLEPERIRFFAVGEYGDRTMRPHYHAALFGLGGCDGGKVIKGECQCRSCSVVRQSWGFGFTSVGELTIKSAMYITGYVAKKMTRPDNPALSGKHPEFARMSRRPGIGAGAMADVASDLMRWKLDDLDDVPNALRHGSTEMPLGRYLRRLLREQIGRDGSCPPQVLEAFKEGLRPVYEAVEVAFPKARGDLKRLLVQGTMEALNEQYGRNVVQRQKKRGSL